MDIPSTVEIDEDGGTIKLREAAENGDVEFLRNCVAANKPDQYYLTAFPHSGNIFHIAAGAEQEEFIREAIEGKLLPVEVVQQLLCQHSKFDKLNPLHLAAMKGNVKIVKMFLNAVIIKEKKDDGDPPPWLQKNENRETPCHVALLNDNEECGLEILRMDMESLSIMLDNGGASLLYLALFSGLDKVAMEIVTSPHSFSASGWFGEDALYPVCRCSSSEKGKDICRLLFKKMPKLIQQKAEDQITIFHTWAFYGKIWPFECLLESNDIIPNVKKIFVELISATDNGGANPLHNLAKNSKSKEFAQVGKLLIDTYKQEEEAHASSNFPTGELQYPWLVQDNQKKTPLDYAMDEGNEEFAKMILSEDKNALKTCQKDVLFVAIEKRFHEVQLKILEIVNEERLTHLLTNDQKQNALHLAPKCTKDFCERLLKNHPDLIAGVDKEGENILHKWVMIGQVWSFEYLFNKWRFSSASLTFRVNNSGNNPLHVAATCTNNESTLQIVKLLVQAFQQHFHYRISWPWCDKNNEGEGALHVAIRCQQDQQLALYLLSLLSKMEEQSMADWLDYYAPKEHLILFLAMEYNCYEVVKTIITKLNKASLTKYLQDSFDDTNILHHLASTCTDAEFGRWLVEEVPTEFITKQNKNEKITPLDVACDKGAARIVKAMLEKDPSAFDKLPFAWAKACKNGHVSVVEAFIDCCPIKFSDHCKEHNDSPLHHIKLRNLTRYEDFLKIQYMSDLINLKDSNEATPLHKAIENGDTFLAEALLKMDNIKCNIKKGQGKTAREMLAQLCAEPESQTPSRWVEMCNSVGFDPNLRTTYFQRKTDLLDVRNTLSLVAALLATITFTAGFTLPGGLNQDTGEAMVVNKAAFAVFLISDTLAMCFSMVVLICLIWSMMFEPNESLYLIDRSVGLLRLALYLTLLAFVTGVYIVVSPKLLWAAILVIVLCSLVGVSVNRQFMYRVFKCIDNLFDIVFSFVKKKCTDDPINGMELGRSQPCHRGESSNQNPTSHLLATEEGEDPRT